MREEWLEEIFERLAKEHHTSAGEIKREMQEYLEGLTRGEIEAGPREERILREQGPAPMELGDFLERLTRELEWERQKEKELFAYLGEEPIV